MPYSAKLTVKQAEFSRWLFTPGSETFGNQVESARKAQYKGNYGTLQSVGAENVLKPVVIAERRRIEAETGKALRVDRDYCIKKLQNIVETSKIERNQLTALSLLGDFTGDKRKPASNPEKLAEMRDRMEVEEVEYRTEYAIKRCKVVSKGAEHEQRRATEALQGA